MNLLARSLAIALAFGYILYSATPTIAMACYELYHLVHLEFIYTLYAALKFASAYFMLWPGRLLSAVIFGGLCGMVYFWRKTRQVKLTRESVQ